MQLYFKCEINIGVIITKHQEEAHHTRNRNKRYKLTPNRLKTILE